MNTPSPNRNTPTMVILAGGTSSRMAPLQDKLLLRFGPEPLLLSQLRRYQSLGFEHIVIVISPSLHDDVARMLKQFDSSLRIDTVTQEEALGMGDAIITARPHLDEDAPVYVTQVHDIVDDSLHSTILQGYRNDPTRAYIAGKTMDTYFPGGYLVVSDDDRVTSIAEKPGAGNEPSRYVNIVAHLYPSAAQLLHAIDRAYQDERDSDDHYEVAMDMLMRQITFQVVPYTGRWSALKYPWHVLDVMEHFLDRIEGQSVSPDAMVAPTATLVGDVVIEAGAKVFPGAAVVGPAYIGRDTIVGNNSLVRHSIVLDNCNVGFTTEVARSYVASGCAMHASRVLDSVFAEDVNFSAGCTTANWRIDRGNVTMQVRGSRIDTGRDKLGAIVGQGAFIGVDVMTMPGVRIGAHAEVGPGVHLRDDLAADSRIYVVQQLVTTAKKG